MRIILLPLTLLALIGCTGEKPNFPNNTGPTTETEDDTGLDDSQIDADGDGYAADVDCDDTDATISPGEDEVCDGADNDCDDEIDEDAVDAGAWYPDRDEDGYGSAEDEAVTACEQPSDYTDNADDCDDYDDTVNPDGVEVCDGLDNDCDLLTDSLDPDIDLDTVTTWHADSDQDGYGDSTQTTAACDQPSGHVLDDTDCDDTAEDVNPGEDELCDGRDNDCDEQVDEDAVDASVHYADADGDSYGDPAAATTACLLPSGYTDNPSDCDDTDAAINPDASEVCDSIDNDCDGDTDDADSSVDTSTGTTFYADDDADGFGDTGDTVEACAQPSGYTTRTGDCDDDDSTVRPSAAEVCDDIDNDCDGDIDDDDDDVDTSGGATFYADADGDGYGDADDTVETCDEPSGYVSDDSDCDDSDGNVNEAAAEVCDGVDNDCDGDTDDYDSDVTDAETFYRDFDGDGFGSASYSASACTAPSSYVSDDTDCDDTDAAINEDAAEVCDGEDNDCDSLIDDDDDSIDASTQGTWYTDDDGDGYGDSDDSTVTCELPSGYAEQGGDCDDTSGAISPAADEICNDIDDDCDGDIDDNDDDVDTSDGGATFYADADGDGYGDNNDTVAACDEPSGYVSDDSDCDDTDGNVNEAADETCDGIDNDCDTLVDDDDGDIDLSTATVFFTDADGDGFGDGSDSTVTCEQPSGTVTDDSDCDDSDASINEDADEVCDGVDNDCDRLIDGDDDDVDTSTGATYFADADGDGYGDSTEPTEACSQPSGTVSDDTDCDDTDGGISPAADEICDDTDNDCDGDIDDDDSSLDASTAESFYADVDGDGFGDSSDTLVRCDQPSGYVSDATDCDDADGDVSPAADEVCDEIDNDCDGKTDTDATDISTWYGDADGDSYGGSTFVKQSCDQPSGYVDNAEDCDDLDASLSPDATEICDDIDNDCDTLIDDDDTDVDTSDGGATFYADTDGDSYGDPSDTTEACDQPSGTVTDATDCDDTDAAINTAAAEVCDSVDNDCDTLIDDADDDVDTSTGSTYYADDDGDGSGDPSDTVAACDEPSGYVSDATDCDDTDGNVNLSATEVCNSVDDDCDGDIDDDDSDVDTTTGDTFYADADDDGYGSTDDTVSACDEPSGYTSDGTDCDDDDSDSNPGASETCDGVDNDCDDDIDEGVIGQSTSCPAESCAEIIDLGADDGDGDYYLDPDGSGGSLYTCDMTTDGGGWTEVVYWNRIDDGDTQSDFESLMTQNYNTMGNFSTTSTALWWNDKDSNTKAMDYDIDIDVDNDGEVLFTLEYYGYSMEDSGVWFYVSTDTGAEEDLWCEAVQSSTTGYSSTELSYIPGYTCGETATSGENLTGSYDREQHDFGDPIVSYHITSLHYDNGTGDISYLYNFAVWVR